LKKHEHGSCFWSFDASVTEELYTGTDWYHWNIQKICRKLGQIIPVLKREFPVYDGRVAYDDP
jgi:hypothetical protein